MTVIDDIRRSTLPRIAPHVEPWLHIPTPGDHYSAATGSATMTVIYELARCHEDHGGHTDVVVGTGTRHDYPTGACREVPFNLSAIGKWERITDVALSRARIPRLLGTRRYLPALPVIDPHYTGPIFIHNNPVAIPFLHNARPKARLFLWCHNQLFRTYTPRETRHIIDACHGVICVSQFIANDLIQRIGPSEKIRVVNNGVDTARFCPSPVPPHGDIPTVLFLGRVQPVKGPDLLLRAAVKIQSPDRRFKIRIVGSSGFSAADPLTAYEHELRELARPLGDSVEFSPFKSRADVIQEYQRASVFCVPSNWDDPCPLTMAEGLAAGLATIAARRGGIPEMGRDAALYFDPPDTDTLAGHLALLLDNPATRALWARRARARAEITTWSNQYDVLIDALR